MKTAREAIIEVLKKYEVQWGRSLPQYMGLIDELTELVKGEKRSVAIDAFNSGLGYAGDIYVRDVKPEAEKVMEKIGLICEEEK